MTKIITLLIFFSSFSLLYSQEIIKPSPIKWYTLQEAQKLKKIQNKPLFIDVYTDWCGFCKKMMYTTFANKSIANYINTNFYAVRFNAETQDTIEYKGVTYVNKGKSGRSAHELAKKMLKNSLSYPTIVYEDLKGNEFAVPGYLEVNQLEPFLIFFAENIGTGINLNDFQLLYFQAFPDVYKKELSQIPDSVKLDLSGSVNWISMSKASEMSKIDKKPIYIYLYTNWSNSCKIMDRTIFRSTRITNLLNEKFHPVKFNIVSQDTVRAAGQTFVGNGKNTAHQFAQALLHKGFKMPAGVFINENNQKTDEIHELFTARYFEIILLFYGEKADKTMSFQKFFNSHYNKN